jgi:hypothetical protein
MTDPVRTLWQNTRFDITVETTARDPLVWVECTLSVTPLFMAQGNPPMVKAADQLQLGPLSLSLEGAKVLAETLRRAIALAEKAPMPPSSLQ